MMPVQNKFRNGAQARAAHTHTIIQFMLNDESVELYPNSLTPVKKNKGGTSQKSKTKTELKGSVVKWITTDIPQKVENIDIALETKATSSRVQV
jgi:hypothetical protein